MSKFEELIKKEFKVIGRHKYDHLKKQLEKLDQNDIEALIKFRKIENISVSDAEKMVAKFEETHEEKPQSEQMTEYFKNLRNHKKEEVEILTDEDFKKILYNKFMFEYRKKNNVKYNLDGDSSENLKPIFYYFLGDFDNFLKCGNLLKSDKFVPSLNKGLLLVGNYGNGKTSTMEAFSEVTKFTKKYFQVIGAKEAVTKYSFLKNDNEKQKLFYDDLVNRKYLFDDILKEDKASSYGITNLFEQILEEKYRKKITTHATLNYKVDNGKVIEDAGVAVRQLGEKYGGYLYDRVFSMFNVIEFKGKSKR